MKSIFSFIRNYLSLFLCGVACVGLFLCFSRLNDLQEQLIHLQETQDNNGQQLQQKLDNFTWDIRNTMEEAQRPILNWEESWGEPDWAAQTVPYTFHITLKEYDPASTTVQLVINGTAQPMTLENGVYTYSAVLPMTQTYKIEKALVQTNGIVQTQTLNSEFLPSDQLVPSFDISQPPICTSRDLSFFEKGGVNCTFNGLIEVTPLKNGPAITLERADVVLYQNGTEVKRLPIDLSAQGQQAYRDLNAKHSNFSATEPADAPADSAYDSENYFPPFCFYIDEADASLTLKREESAEARIEMQSSNGLIYALPFWAIEVLPSGLSREPDIWPWEIEPAIYAADGTLLHQSSYRFE